MQCFLWSQRCRNFYPLVFYESNNWKLVVGTRYLFLPFIPLTFAMTETPREVIPTGWVPGQGTAVASCRPLVKAGIRVKVHSETVLCCNSGVEKLYRREQPVGGVQQGQLVPGWRVTQERASASCCFHTPSPRSWPQCCSRRLSSTAQTSVWSRINWGESQVTRAASWALCSESLIQETWLGNWETEQTTQVVLTNYVIVRT